MDGLFAEELAQWSRPVLRNYWSDDRSYTADIGGSGRNTKEQEIERAIYVPLGPRQEFQFVDETERLKWPATHRPRLFNLLVTLSTHPARVKIAIVVEKIQARGESKIKEGNDASRKGGHQRPEEMLLPGEDTALVHNARKWRPFLPPECDHRANDRKGGRNCRSHIEQMGADTSMAATSAPEDGMSGVSSGSSTAASHAEVANFTGLYNGHNLPTEAYRRTLLESVFTICPSGHSSETFRLFEAVEAGSIPIVDRALESSWSKQLEGSDQSPHKSSYALKIERRRLKGSTQATATGQCIDSMRPFRDSSAPFLWITNWEAELEPLLTKMRKAPLEVLARQKALAIW
jgi:hypothetical protein